MPSPISVLTTQLTDEPHVTADDLDGVLDFINQLSNVVGHHNHDVRVESAVLLLTNETGYNVGHLVYELEWDSFRFVPFSPSSV